MSKIGNVLKSLRVREDLTQEELAKVLNMTRSSIGMYEQGKRIPPPDVLEVFADFFNVDMNYITGRTDREYYLDLETRQIAQEIFDSSDMKLLFSAARNTDGKTLRATADFLKRLKEKEDN